MLKAIEDHVEKGKTRISGVVRQVVDTVYPPRCLACPSPTETAQGLCGTCWRETFFFAGQVCDLCGVNVPTAAGHQGRIVCDSCSHAPPAWDQGRSAVAYEGIGRRLALGLKHGDRLDTVRPLARWMAHAGAPIIKPETLLVPVPLHWRRLFGRTYNQAGELARAIAAQTGADVAPNTLRRTLNTAPQLGTREARFAAVQDVFAIPSNLAQSISGRSILLIDDVMTSGATLSACTETLRDAGADGVDVLVLARVARET